MDKATVGGTLLALFGILVALVVEGGHLSQVLQPTAALIVFGGTIGAVLIQFPLKQCWLAAGALRQVFLQPNNKLDDLELQLLDFANKARRHGIVSLDSALPSIGDPFLQRSLTLAVDGTAPNDLRKMMELELDHQAELEERIPQVFEAAGGYSPTIGIIGAVLGLIQVMQHLQDINEVGKGIAVAFVATIYGVGAANLFFLPAAGKIRIRLREIQVVREISLLAVIFILEGMNPRMLQARLAGLKGSLAPRLKGGSR